MCQLTPTATSLTLTFSSAPFPVTLAANSPLAFQLDIHLNTVIQPDLSVNLGATNGVTISQLPHTSVGGAHLRPRQFDRDDPKRHRCGVRDSTCASSDYFTLQTGDGRTFTIDVNSSTTYNYPSTVCSTDNFACLATGQIVNVALSLQTDGTLLASQVNYVQPAGQMVVVGNIVGLSFPVSYPAGNAVMDLIPQQGPPRRPQPADFLPSGNWSP